MQDAYHIREVTGESSASIEQAIENAILEGYKLHGHVAWYDVTSTQNEKSLFKACLKMAYQTH